METGDRDARRVLIIDDETDMLEVLKLRLRVAAFGVETACEGEEGLAKAATTRPDVVLLDIAMPGMDGYEVCRRLRADPKTRDIPVVMLTALGSAGVVESGFAAGAAAVLFKPFESGTLLATLRQAL